MVKVLMAIGMIVVSGCTILPQGQRIDEGIVRIQQQEMNEADHLYCKRARIDVLQSRFNTPELQKLWSQWCSRNNSVGLIKNGQL